MFCINGLKEAVLKILFKAAESGKKELIELKNRDLIHCEYFDGMISPTVLCISSFWREAIDYSGI